MEEVFGIEKIIILDIIFVITSLQLFCCVCVCVCVNLFLSYFYLRTHTYNTCISYLLSSLKQLSNLSSVSTFVISPMSVSFLSVLSPPQISSHSLLASIFPLFHVCYPAAMLLCAVPFCHLKFRPQFVMSNTRGGSQIIRHIGSLIHKQFPGIRFSSMTGYLLRNTGRIAPSCFDNT